MNDNKPECMEEAMEAINKGEVFHSLMFCISWNTKKMLPDKYLAIIHITIMQFSQANNWQLHKLKINHDQVLMIIQIGLETSVNDMIAKIKNVTDAALKREFKDIIDDSIWGDNLWIESTDKQTLNNFDNQKYCN